MIGYSKYTLKIGITGASGSGKTYLTEKLVEYFAGKVTHFKLDNYYYERKKQPKDENGEYNFDTPSSLDLDTYYIAFKSLIEGFEVSQQVYDYNNPKKKAKEPKFILVAHNDIVIADGIFSYFNENARKLFDYRIYVEANEKLRLERRIKRDSTERGYEAEDVIYKFKHHLAFANKEYVEPMKEHSHCIFINEKDTFETEFEKLVNILEKELNKKQSIR